MNKVQKKIEYSLIALKHMRTKPAGELTTAKEVAETYRAPFDVTARVMQVMAQKGLLKSAHGAGGGYLLKKDLKEISLQELIDAIQGPTQIAKCLQDHEECDIQSTCNIISPITRLNNKLNEFYKNLSVEELISR